MNKKIYLIEIGDFIGFLFLQLNSMGLIINMNLWRVKNTLFYKNKGFMEVLSKYGLKFISL